MERLARICPVDVGQDPQARWAKFIFHRVSVRVGADGMASGLEVKTALCLSFLPCLDTSTLVSGWAWMSFCDWSSLGREVPSCSQLTPVISLYPNPHRWTPRLVTCEMVQACPTSDAGSIRCGSSTLESFGLPFLKVHSHSVERKSVETHTVKVKVYSGRSVGVNTWPGRRFRRLG